MATATAAGIRSVAEAIKLPGGQEAVQLRVAEQYIGQFGELAKKSNTIVLPANVADVGSMIALAMKLIQKETLKSRRVRESRVESRRVEESRRWRTNEQF